MGERSKENVSNIKNILEEFSVFSGLKCNFSKTSIMPIGPNKHMDSEESCGLNVVTSIKLLGMDIDCNLENLRDNFDSTVKKWKK